MATERKRATNAAYLAKLDKILLRMPQGDKEIIKAAADAAGQSVNAYILTAIKQRMDETIA